MDAQINAASLDQRATLTRAHDLFMKVSKPTNYALIGREVRGKYAGGPVATAQLISAAPTASVAPGVQLRFKCISLAHGSNRPLAHDELWDGKVQMSYSIVGAFKESMQESTVKKMSEIARRAQSGTRPLEYVAAIAAWNYSHPTVLGCKLVRSFAQSL